MGKKYIIELPENTHWIQWIMKGTKDGHPYMDYRQVEDLTPYTEPDLEQVREKAYIQGLKDGQVVAVANEQNNAFNDGYKKCLKDMEQVRKEAYEKGLSDSKNQDDKDFADMYDSGYSEGLKNAWDAARKIACDKPHGGFRIDTKQHIFGAADYAYILANYNASEAVEKIRQYEQEKEEIKVGDVVEAPFGAAIVTYAEGNRVEFFHDSGVYGWDKKGNITKTGKFFPEIAEVLKKLKEIE